MSETRTETSNLSNLKKEFFYLIPGYFNHTSHKPIDQPVQDESRIPNWYNMDPHIHRFEPDE